MQLDVSEKPVKRYLHLKLQKHNTFKHDTSSEKQKLSPSLHEINDTRQGMHEVNTTQKHSRSISAHVKSHFKEKATPFTEHPLGSISSSKLKFQPYSHVTQHRAMLFG